MLYRDLCVDDGLQEFQKVIIIIWKQCLQDTHEGKQHALIDHALVSQILTMYQNIEVCQK